MLVDYSNVSLARTKIVFAHLIVGIAACSSGCGLSQSSHEPTAAELQALMTDGPLPTAMQPGSMPTVAPPRFCGGDFPKEMDGGVVVPPIPSTGVGSGSGTSSGTGTGVMLPSKGAMIAGNGAAGSGSAGGTDAGMVGGSGGTSGGSTDAGMGSTGGTGGAMGGTGGMSGGGTGGFMGGTGGMGGGMPGAGCESVPIGFWRFDDCNGSRTDLQDSSFQGHTAFRNVDLACGTGQESQAVTFANKGDLVYAPDQPDFALDQGVTVAAWIKPSRVDGVATIFRKRDDGESAFALLVNGRKLQFVVKLESGALASVSSAIKAGVWTHVAATYDGTNLKLYENGSEVASTHARGVLTRGVGPLLIGNDAKERRFPGLIDSAWFNTLAAPDTTIMKLTCLHKPPTATVQPASSGPVAGGTTVSYTLSLTNNDSASCDPENFQVFTSLPQGFDANPFFSTVFGVASGDTGTASVDVTSGEETDPGTYSIGFFVSSFDQPFMSNLAVSADYVVAEPTGCHVTSNRELTIRDVSVVDDPVRTSLAGPSSDARTGAWTFGRMMERIASSAAAAPDMTEAMFRTFLTPQTVNGFSIEARPAMDPVVLRSWPRTSGGKLDLAQAPLRLLAIVNRLDLTRLEQGKAGEGRLVYGMLDASGTQLQFTVILEYLLPASDQAGVKAWADAFHALQALPFPSEDYNAALQAITDRITARGAVPSRPNGSALIDIRTNEIALSFQWQLREFHLSADGSAMEPATLFDTPDSSFNFSDRLGRFINANEAAILAETHDVPPLFEGEPFQAAAVFNNIDSWDAPGIDNPEARHKFSLNTCNGCHGGETNTGFLHISPRDPGQPSQLSGFLLGETVFDRVTGEPRRLAELSRRRKLLESLVCPTSGP